MTGDAPDPQPTWEDIELRIAVLKGKLRRAWRSGSTDDGDALGRELDELRKLLDRFAKQVAAQRVKEERARCAWLAGDECRSRDELIAGIRDGERP